MVAIDRVSAPLVIRHADGSEQLVAACFPHPAGLLYLDPYWHLSTPERAAHLIRGELTGEGPWKVGGAVIRVLGCHNTDPELQQPFLAWQDYLREHPDDYPPAEQIRSIARRLGALPSD